MQILAKSLIKGIISFLPGSSRFTNLRAGNPVGARYYYSVWLRHLVHGAEQGQVIRLGVVGELGPGDGLGLGLCALLCGAARYIALDRLPFAARADNVRFFDDLLTLFANRAPIPDDAEFPRVYPKLQDYSFPHALLTENQLQASLNEARVKEIRSVLQNIGFDNAYTNSHTSAHARQSQTNSRMISYIAPWDSADQIADACVDFLISQAVMEHVDALDAAYAAMRRWIKPTGLMSHRINYTCHGITRDWYGHWTIGATLWRLVRGKRAYLINRQPHSAQLAAIQRNQLTVVASQLTRAEQPAPSQHMRVPFQPEDCAIQGATLLLRSTSA